VARHGPAEVADPAVAQQVAARFSLGEVTGEMRSAARPDEVGRRWLLTTGRGRWTAQTVDDVYPVTDGEDNARFQEAAARAGVTLPLPVRSTAGAVTEQFAGHRWRVYAWLRSGPPLTAPVSAAVTRAVGAVLATLHGLRTPAPLCPWSSTRLDTRSWAELAELAAAKGAGWAPLLAAAVPTLDGLAFDGPVPADPVLCHNNLNPGNVRAAAHDTLVVTGWEHAAGLPPAWELAAALASWTVHPGGEVNEAGVRALLDGYGTRPGLDLDSFRGTATAMQNYVAGQIELALAAGADDRGVRHLLTHLPSRATYERILAAMPRSG
jgi:hypothetical protein